MAYNPFTSLTPASFTIDSNTTQFINNVKRLCELVTGDSGIEGFGTAAGRDFGPADGQIPLWQHLGTSRSYDVGPAGQQLPTNDILDSAYIANDRIGTGADDLWLASQITAYVAAQIAAIPAGPGGGALVIPDGFITNAMLADDSIFGAKIANGSITTPKLGGLSVTAAKIALQTITAAQMANDSVVNRMIANDAVSTDNILDNAITGGKIAALAVAAGHLADNSVGYRQFDFTGQTTAGHLFGIGMHEGAHIIVTIDPATLTTAPLTINNDSIGLDKLIFGGTEAQGKYFTYGASNRIELVDVPSGGGGALTDGSVEHRHLAADAVEHDNIKDGNVIRSKINADAVDGSKIADLSVGKSHIAWTDVDEAVVGKYLQLTNGNDIAPVDPPVGQQGPPGPQGPAGDVNVVGGSVSTLYDGTGSTTGFDDLQTIELTEELERGYIVNFQFNFHSTEGSPDITMVQCLSDNILDLPERTTAPPSSAGGLTLTFGEGTITHYIFDVWRGTGRTLYLHASHPVYRMHIRKVPITGPAAGPAEIADDSVTTGKVRDRAIVSEKIGLQEVFGQNIANGEIDTVHLQDEAVNTNKLHPGAVTASKIHADTIHNYTLLSTEEGGVDFSSVTPLQWYDLPISRALTAADDGFQLLFTFDSTDANDRASAFEYVPVFLLRSKVISTTNTGTILNGPDDRLIIKAQQIETDAGFGHDTIHLAIPDGGDNRILFARNRDRANFNVKVYLVK